MKPQAPNPGHWRDVDLEANADVRNNPHTLKEGVIGSGISTHKTSTPKKQVAQWESQK